MLWILLKFILNYNDNFYDYRKIDIYDDRIINIYLQTVFVIRTSDFEFKKKK